ncbi:MAG: hypothetical protein LBO05_02715 [Deltaproteobacteria bacterium]|jgi:hypothetical protein|nr:hypothetical protein [Deltaproteobacteria bacterium]
MPFRIKCDSSNVDLPDPGTIFSDAEPAVLHGHGDVRNKDAGSERGPGIYGRPPMGQYVVRCRDCGHMAAGLHIMWPNTLLRKPECRGF